MKKSLIGFLVVVFSAAPVFSETPDQEEKVDTALQGYLELLDSDNPALRHSAICHIAQLKSKYTDLDFSEAIKPLTRISQKDSFYHLRDYAMLALMYLEDSALSKEIKLDYAGDASDFFDELHELAHMEFYEKVYYSHRKAEGK